MTDLANELIRETYRKKTSLSKWMTRSPESLRRAVVESKKFVMDDSMSEFSAELSTVPFDVVPERRADVLASMRHSAIPPFAKMFVQLDNHSFRRGLLKMGRQKDVYGNPLLDPDSIALDVKDQLVNEIGWLIELDGDDVMITEFFIDDGQVMSLPFYYIYSLSDKGYHPGPFRGGYLDVNGAMLSHGLTNVGPDDRMAVVYHRPVDQFPNSHLNEVDDHIHGGSFTVHKLVVEFGGILRYVMCFLAVLNDIPRIETVVRPQKGFLGGGQIRKYMDHTTLTLTLPAKTTKLKLAQRLIAKARRGWHAVRPHWRMLKAGTCKTHLWTERDSTGHSHCTDCDAKRVYIVLPHGRGDPTLSVRTHNYRITHEVA